VVVADNAFAQQLHSALGQAIATGADKVLPDALLARSTFQRGMDWLALGLMRFAIWLTGRRY
jgi:cardiolipin synthase